MRNIYYLYNFEIIRNIIRRWFSRYYYVVWITDEESQMKDYG